MKKQIFVIHGGDVFDSYEEYLDFLKKYSINIEKIKCGTWKDSLQEKLGNDFEVIYPAMPNKYNAKYAEWKIWFEKFIPFLKDDIILIGGSLGGLFLAKYLSENEFSLKIKAVILVAPPFSDDYLGDFKITGSLEKFRKQADNIVLYQSKDDTCVSFSEHEKYVKELPEAEEIIFENRGHFTQKEFPEIVEKIKSLK